ncbi:MAG: nicotinate-nucleotide adenylyltransferase [Planctomycetota bacterium]|jgi:nicotinate-nucleotide adenylyltransferase
MTDGRKILLFGGTFDPVHNGHLVIARAVAERGGFELVRLIPSATPPHKASAAAGAADRLAMLALAIEGDGLFDICDLELRREGVSYTLDTLRELHEREPGAELHWLIGADMLADLHKWYRVEEVVKLVRFVIAAREPWQDQLEPVFQKLAEHFSEEVMADLRTGAMDTPLIDISSTDIRQRVAAGEPVDDLVPAAVADYIDAQGLYR